MYAHMVMVTDIVMDMVMCDEYELMLVREGGAADDARLHRHRVTVLSRRRPGRWADVFSMQTMTRHSCPEEPGAVAPSPHSVPSATRARGPCRPGPRRRTRSP